MTTFVVSKTGKRFEPLPPTERGRHEPEWRFQWRMQRRQQILDAEVFTETDAEGRTWTVRRLSDAHGLLLDDDEEEKPLEADV